jgi:hypothetical protein
MIAEASLWVRERSPHVAHLERTHDWVLELDPLASEALQLAALTHDMERGYPDGSPRWEADRGWDDPLYTIAHCERSARIVGDLLRDRGADEGLVRHVVQLILHHETGGFEEADILQAADSLSFMETMPAVVATWVIGGRSSVEQAKGRMRYAVERVRHERAHAIAEGMLESSLRCVDQEIARARA